ncbi:MAG TPA: SCO family protein [Burkholderiales bacterium]|nr:SCO family protein [Burkholderiales bacterium]
MEQQERSSWRPVVLLLALAAMPVLVATAMYFSGWRPSGDTSHGQLYRPAKPMSEFSLRRDDGSAFGLADLKGKWTLIYLLPSPCEAACVRALYVMRMAHLGQGKEQDRVRRLVAGGTAEIAEIHRADPALVALSGTAEELQRLGAQMAMEQDGGPRIYLADPMGNLVLRFDPAADPAGLRKDLGHLLKHSWVG